MLLMYYSLFLLYKGDDPEQDDGADDSSDNLPNEGGAPVDTKPAEDVAADETANDTDKEINPEAEAGTFHDFACQETCQCTDKNCDDNTHNNYILLVNNRFMYGYCFINLATEVLPSR